MAQFKLIESYGAHWARIRDVRTRSLMGKGLLENAMLALGLFESVIQDES